MKPDITHAYFQGNLAWLRGGSIGHAILPFLLRHFRIRPEQIKIISAAEGGAEVVAIFRVPFEVVGYITMDSSAWQGPLFSEDVDADDPWQFKNFRVT